MNCPRCGLPFVEGRECSAGTKQEHCVEERQPRVWKLKPKEVLECARFTFPYIEWIVGTSGQVISSIDDSSGGGCVFQPLQPLRPARPATKTRPIRLDLPPNHPGR